MSRPMKPILFAMEWKAAFRVAGAGVVLSCADDAPMLAGPGDSSGRSTGPRAAAVDGSAGPPPLWTTGVSSACQPPTHRNDHGQCQWHAGRVTDNAHDRFSA